MTRRHASLLLSIAPVFVLGWLGALGATFVRASAGGMIMLAAAGILSMDQAVRMTERQYHAKVVKAETQKEGGRTIYVLRMLNDTGHVWTVRVDAATGSVQ